MKFLKSYTGAMVVLATVIVVSVLFGSHRSLTAERAKVEAMFYSGTDGSGYSIATDLDDCLGITANVITVAERYLDAGDLEALEGSRRELEASLDAGTAYYSIGNACAAYQRLAERAELVLTALEDCALSEQDARYVMGFRDELAAKADTISRDHYNEQVDIFNGYDLGRFPANVLGRITFVREAEAFRAP